MNSDVDILEPREGIGGHCLPKDTKMFLESSKSRKNKIVVAAIAAIEVDQDYRTYRDRLEPSLKYPVIMELDSN